MRFLKLLTIYDKILIVFVIVLSLLTIFLYPIIINASNKEKYAVIKINSREICRYKLDGSERIEEFYFKVKGKEYSGKLEIDGERVRLHRLPKEIVPLAIHADMGWVDKIYQMIVALPIKLTVQIETPVTVKSELDGVAY